MVNKVNVRATTRVNPKTGRKEPVRAYVRTDNRTRKPIGKDYTEIDDENEDKFEDEQRKPLSDHVKKILNGDDARKIIDLVKKTQDPEKLKRVLDYAIEHKDDKWRDTRYHFHNALSKNPHLSTEDKIRFIKELGPHFVSNIIKNTDKIKDRDERKLVKTEAWHSTVKELNAENFIPKRSWM